MGFQLTRYGRREWLGGSLVLGLACAALIDLATTMSAWFWPALAVPAALWAWLLWFFRDPSREAPQGAGLLVSPADGTVADVTLLGPDSPLGREGVQVGIFMSLFDVHVNRSPEAARVERVEYRKGSFLDARDVGASSRNESATIHMTCTGEGGEFPIVVRQVAGLLARRIVTDVSAGEPLHRGQRIGMIKFGSRVELMAPRDRAAQVRVAVGQEVRAGQTVLIASAPEDGK